MASSLTEVKKSPFHKSLRYLYSFNTLAVYVDNNGTIIVSNQSNPLSYTLKSSIANFKANEQYMVVVYENQEVEVLRINDEEKCIERCICIDSEEEGTVQDVVFSPYNNYLLALVYSSKIIRIDLRTLYDVSVSFSSIEQTSYLKIIECALDSQQERFVSYCFSGNDSSIVIRDSEIEVQSFNQPFTTKLFSSIQTTDYAFVLSYDAANEDNLLSLVTLHMLRLNDLSLFPPVHFLLPKELATADIRMSPISASACILWSPKLVSCFLFSLEGHHFSALNLLLTSNPVLFIPRALQETPSFILQIVVQSQLLALSLPLQLIADRGVTDTLLDLKRLVSDVDLFSTVPQASLYSVCGESTITCETVVNDLDSIPAAVNDSSDTELMEDGLDSLVTSDVSSAPSFHLIAASALNESDSNSVDLPSMSNSLSIEESNSECDDDMVEYVVKKSKPYRPRRSRSPPRNQVFRRPENQENRGNQENQENQEQEQSPKPILRPSIHPSMKPSAKSARPAKPVMKPITKPARPVMKPIAKPASMPQGVQTNSISLVSETPKQSKFVFNADIYSKVNKKLSSSGYAPTPSPIESTEIGSQDPPQPEAEQNTSNSTSAQFEIIRAHHSQYQLQLDNIDRIKDVNLSKYLHKKDSKPISESPVDDTPIDDTPVDESVVYSELEVYSELDVDAASESIFDLINMGDSAHELKLFQQPEKQLELMMSIDNLESFKKLEQTITIVTNHFRNVNATVLNKLGAVAIKTASAQKKCSRSEKEFGATMKSLPKTVKERTSCSALTEEDGMARLLGDCMVNEVAPSIENALNDVFGTFVDGYGNEVQEVKTAVENLKESVDCFVETVELQVAEQSQATILDSLLRDNHANEIIQFAVDNNSEVVVNKVVAQYQDTWLDEVSEPILLLEFANIVCDNLAKMTEARCDILFDIAFNATFEKTDKRTAELMNSVAGKLAVYQREANKHMASSSLIITINRLQNYYAMM